MPILFVDDLDEDLVCLLFFTLFSATTQSVDFRSRRFAFRGASGEPPRRFVHCTRKIGHFFTKQLSQN